MGTPNFTELDRQLQDVMKETGFSLRSPFAERHGSIETVFCRKEDNGLSRFVSIALTAADGSEGRWLVEVYLVAEDDVYTRRELTSSFVIGSEDLLDGWKERLQRSIEDALRVAQDFRPTELRPDQVWEARPAEAVAR